MNYKQLIEKEIPDLLKECSTANWDGYEAGPISQETANRTIIILKKLKAMNISCPHISPSDGCISIEWGWYKGDWKKSVKEQERYAWTIMIEVGDHVFDEKGDCLYFDSDSREGVSKNNTITNSIYFCFKNEIPEKAIERIKELEKWIDQIP